MYYEFESIDYIRHSSGKPERVIVPVNTDVMFWTNFVFGHILMTRWDIRSTSAYVTLRVCTCVFAPARTQLCVPARL